MVGTVPVFIMAGFIEGFVTRHTELPDALRFGFILLSLSFIFFIIFIYLTERSMEAQKPKIALYVQRSLERN